MFALLLLPAVATAQEVVVDGQVRPRFEFRDPSGASGASESFTIGRTRLGVTVRREDGIWGRIQFQDVRIWGEESSTVGDFRADGLDLHQGFLQIGAEDARRSLRLGRFEQNYGGQRLIGAVGWAQQARAFDGVRARGRFGSEWATDAFVFELSESASPFRNLDARFTGIYTVWTPGEGNILDLYGFLLEEDRATGVRDTRLVTAGARYVGAREGWMYRLEGTVQRGERGPRDVAAWMLGVRLGRSVAEGRGSITLWADLLSGSAPGSEDDRAFDTLFGTNHKFYGFADLFLNPVAQTQGRGLQDFALKTRWELADAWTATADLHRFRVAEGTGLASNVLADELDLVVSHPMGQGLVLSGGYALVSAGDALAAVRGLSGNRHFAYVMFDLVFQ